MQQGRNVPASPLHAAHCAAAVRVQAMRQPAAAADGPACSVLCHAQLLLRCGTQKLHAVRISNI